MIPWSIIGFPVNYYQLVSILLFPAMVRIFIFCKLLCLVNLKCSFRNFSWRETRSSTTNIVHYLRLGYFSTSSWTAHQLRGRDSRAPSQTALGSWYPFPTYSQRTSYAIRSLTTTSSCCKQRYLLSIVWWALLKRPRVWAQDPEYRVHFSFKESCRYSYPFLVKKYAC